MLTGANLIPMRRVPTGGVLAWTSIPFPAPGNALNWGDRLTFDNNPETTPYGEASTTVAVVSFDGRESRVSVKGGQVHYDGNGPVWPVRLEQWIHSHANVGAWVIDKAAEDQGRHKAQFWTENTGLDGTMVPSNVLEYEVS